MNAIVFIKLMVSIFLLNIFVTLVAKYIYLVFQRVSEDKLRSYFGRMWIYGFLISMNLFGLIIIWFPKLFHDDFFTNPIPTFIFVVVASLIFATVGAISAKQPSNSVVVLKKIQKELKSFVDKKDKL